MKPVGVLALQGGYDAHARCLNSINVPWVLVRTPSELTECGGLILPGGESTTHLKLIERFELGSALQTFVAAGNPVLATCAGLILSATHVSGPEQPSFGWLDIDVERNGWGRQVHSFEASLDDPLAPPILNTQPPFALMFIRAPKITRCGENVEVIARFRNEAVAVRQGSFYGMSFHPELKNDARFHALVFKTGS
jgi:5'-phosphate synthase pdxT subunit